MKITQYRPFALNCKKRGTDVDQKCLDKNRLFYIKVQGHILLYSQ